MIYKTYCFRANKQKEVIHVSWDNKGIRKSRGYDANTGAPRLTSLTFLFRYNDSTESRACAAFFVFAGRFLCSDSQNLTQRVEGFVDFTDAVVVHRADANCAAGVINTKCLRHFDSVIVAAPGEDVFLRE